MLPRPGLRHFARLVERKAAETDWIDLPVGPSQLDTRTWQWCVRRVPDPEIDIGAGAWIRWVIARRRPENPAERDYYLAWGPPKTPVEALVRAPGARWRVEEAIKLAKSAACMADYEVRSFHGWYRHITLASWRPRSWRSTPPRLPVTPPLILSSAHRRRPQRRPGYRRREGAHTRPTGLAPIAFTAYEIRRLLIATGPHSSSAEHLRHGLH